jgi:hypothetical protein
VQLLFLNISPLILLTLSKSLGILLGSWYATKQSIDIELSGLNSWSSPSKKIKNLKKRIAEYNRSQQKSIYLAEFSSIDKSINLAQRNLFLWYIFYSSCSWLILECLDYLRHLNSESTRIFSPSNMLIDIPITAVVTHIILSCDDTIEAEGGLITDLIKFIQNILSFGTLKQKQNIGKELSRYEQLELYRFPDYDDGDEIIRRINVKIDNMGYVSLQHKYREKFSQLRAAIERRIISDSDLEFNPTIDHCTAYEQLLLVYIGDCKIICAREKKRI